MKIQTPISNLNELAPLIEAGADEFYCGYLPSSWIDTYDFEVPINCRGTYPKTNINELSELSLLVEKAHQYGKEVYITFNENSYNDNEIKKIVEIVKELVEIKVDGLIISAISLILMIRKMNFPIKVMLSGEANCTNSYYADFVHQMGVERIVFPRHVSIAEMKAIIKHQPDMEYEAFILNESCFFNGGHCYSIHYNNYSQMCYSLNYDLKSYSKNSSFKDKNGNEYNRGIEIRHRTPRSIQNDTLITKCGLCSIKLMQDIGVDCIKIVGRTATLKDKINWTKIVKQTVLFAEQAGTYVEYAKSCKDFVFGNRQGISCNDKRNCYYPDEISMNDLSEIQEPNNFMKDNESNNALIW